MSLTSEDLTLIQDLLRGLLAPIYQRFDAVDARFETIDENFDAIFKFAETQQQENLAIGQQLSRIEANVVALTN